MLFIKGSLIVVRKLSWAALLARSDGTLQSGVAGRFLATRRSCLFSAFEDDFLGPLADLRPPGSVGNGFSGRFTAIEDLGIQERYMR